MDATDILTAADPDPHKAFHDLNEPSRIADRVTGRDILVLVTSRLYTCAAV